MQNVNAKVEGKELVIRIDLTKTLGPSKTGKTILIATTAGNKAIDGGGGAVLGLNLYKKAT